MSEERPLTEPQARLLFAVWKDKQGKHSKGLTYEGIQTAMRKGLADAERGTSLANIKKMARALLTRKPPLLHPSRTGKQATSFRLVKGAMVTWPATAQILLDLEDDPRDSVQRSLFIQRMLHLGVKDPETGAKLTENEIEQHIDYCRDVEFPYISQDSKGFLTTTNRVEIERAFLEKISTFERPADRSAATA